jgi:hypothetical protein
MAKFNEFQKATIISALGMYAKALKQEIRDVEASGKRSFMTEGFVDMQVKEIIDTVKVNSKK